MFDITDEMIGKYAMIGPRYTSYPTAPMWHEINGDDQKKWLQANAESDKAVSIYIHIPFCKNRCLYCGCNVIITRQQSASAEYVSFILREIDALAELRKGNMAVKQLHFGGGTPNFLLNEEFIQIMERLGNRFDFNEETEIGIEIDPCTTRPGQLKFLYDMGFNRLSLGVQDFDETVQNAVQRVQSKDITLEHLDTARSLGFKGINFDLIYGLPFQTTESFKTTVAQVIEMRPDRLAVYNFGYLPNRMIHQRKIKSETLPGTKTKLEILLGTINQFCEAGYRYIGMDHFALPEDELSLAQKNRTLYRNFMGYTPKSEIDLYGIGITAISEFDNYFIQNEKNLKSYKQQIGEKGLSACRGIELSPDDQKRKWAIIRLICHFYLDFCEFKAAFDTDFLTYFKDELELLKAMEEDGLLEIHSDCIKVIHQGQILVRNICMVFDAYLKRSDVPKIKYSKTI
jgi:oxygen-independent coproporphyrinogen III oxidase